MARPIPRPRYLEKIPVSIRLAVKEQKKNVLVLEQRFQFGRYIIIIIIIIIIAETFVAAFPPGDAFSDARFLLREG
jgi:hypothetical protein